MQCLLAIFGMAGVAFFLSREPRAMPPLAPELLEDYLGCPSPSLAAASLGPLINGVHHKGHMGLMCSAVLSAARRRVRALRKLPRVQIANGTLHASCPAGDGCASIHHELRTLQLLLRVSRVADVDFL